MENFQDRGVWIRIRFVLRGWIRILSISDRIRNPAHRVAGIFINALEIRPLRNSSYRMMEAKPTVRSPEYPADERVIIYSLFLLTEK